MNEGLPNHGFPGSTTPVAGNASPLSISFMPSRSIARFNACRTLMSFSGLPSTRLNVYGQECGITPVSTCIPPDFSRATVSGAGLSIQSTWPLSSAAVRVPASGTGSSTSLAHFGTRPLSQYASFRCIDAWSRGTYWSSTQGPVPEGALPNSNQLPAAAHRAGLDIIAAVN